MSNTTQIFDHYEDGEYKAINIRRGTKGMGKLSDDSAYAAKNLYPVVGTKPSYDSKTHNCSGPTRSFNDIDKTSVLGWSVTEKPIEDLRAAGKVSITKHRQSKDTGVIPITISSGTFNYPYSLMISMEHFNLWQAVTAGVATLPSYWRDDDDNNNAVILADFLVMSGAIKDYLLAMGQRSHADKALIDTATTAAEIDAIVLSYMSYDPLV